MINLKFPERNAYLALKCILQIKNVQVTSKTIIERLYLHPDFPTIASLSDTLNEWNIANLVTRIELRELSEMPLPAILFLDIYGGYYAPVRKISLENGIEWFDTLKGWRTERFSEFTQKWSGVALIFDPDQNSGEMDYFAKKREEFLENVRYPFLFTSLTLTAILWIIGNIEDFRNLSWNIYALLFAKVIGVLISCVMLWSTIDLDNPFLRNLCGITNGTNCNNILDSKASRFCGWFTWSEIGLVYFSGGLLSLLTSINLPSVTILGFVVALNLITIPYTLFSLYYQAIVAKRWCLLCLIVQIIFWVELSVGFPILLNASLNLDVYALSALCLCFLLPSMLWAFVKEPLKQSVRVYPLLRELNRTKFNYGYVTSLFNNNPIMPPKFDGMLMPSIGNPNSQHTLTVVTNPVCGPCAKAHAQLEALIKETTTIRCEFVFLGPAKAMRVASVLLQLPQDAIGQEMHNWYSRNNQDIESWKKKIDITKSMETEHEQLQLHARWSELAKVTATPTLFLNGIALPTCYTIGDIKMLLATLPEHEETLT